MKENGHNFWICLDDLEPVGYVGIISDDIRVATHPDHQKKGIGAFMINEIMKIYPNAYAKVKLENEASIKLFEHCNRARNLPRERYGHSSTRSTRFASATKLIRPSTPTIRTGRRRRTSH